MVPRNKYTRSPAPQEPQPGCPLHSSTQKGWVINNVRSLDAPTLTDRSHKKERDPNGHLRSYNNAPQGRGAYRARRAHTSPSLAGVNRKQHCPAALRNWPAGWQPRHGRSSTGRALAAHCSPGWWRRRPLVPGSSSTDGGTVQPASTGGHTDRPQAHHSWAQENQGLQIATQRPRHRSASPNGPAPIQTRWCPVMSAAPCSVGRPWPVGTGSFLS